MTAPHDALPISVSDAEVHAALRVLHEDYDPVAYHTEDEIRRAIAAALAARGK
ncbi:MAG: hypothetical protein KA200_00215 [Burkholderiales bacterium]|nr:hypothetical protein [Burkholderiales bacterium]